MESIKERTEFSKRLKIGLGKIGQPIDSPAALAREFNRRYPGGPITNYAARKWLMSESIPSQDKLKVLAQWLGVTNSWLRFGLDEGAEPTSPENAGELDYTLMRLIAALPPDHQRVVRDLVTSLRKIGGH